MCIRDRPRVLVIDDDPALLRVLRISLSAHDYDVIFASTGAQGISETALHSPDVVVLEMCIRDRSCRPVPWARSGVLDLLGTRGGTTLGRPRWLFHERGDLDAGCGRHAHRVHRLWPRRHRRALQHHRRRTRVARRPKAPPKAHQGPGTPVDRHQCGQHHLGVLRRPPDAVSPMLP